MLTGATAASAALGPCSSQCGGESGIRRGIVEGPHLPRPPVPSVFVSVLLQKQTALVPSLSKNPLCHPVSGASRNRSTRLSMVRNIFLGMATSAIWKVIYFARCTTFAAILMSLSRRALSIQCFTVLCQSATQLCCVRPRCGSSP